MEKKKTLREKKLELDAYLILTGNKEEYDKMYQELFDNATLQEKRTYYWQMYTWCKHNGPKNGAFTYKKKLDAVEEEIKKQKITQ